MSERKKIAEATLIIGAFAVVGKILGFIREIIIAAFFGTTYRTDAYFIGMAGPDFIREIISGSVLTAVFIPVYTAALAKNDPEKTEKFLNTTVAMLTIALVTAAVLGFPLASLVVKAVAPEADGQTFKLAVEITRIIFPAMIFMGLASFYGNLLNVHRHFLTPSMSQAMLNTGVIAGVVLFSSMFGVRSLAIGFLIGAVLQFAVLLPSLKERAVKFRFSFSITPEMKKMFEIWGPLFIASFVATANDLVSRSLAAGIGEGNVAGITFANRIRETIWLLCAVPLGTAVFPYLSEYAAAKNTKELERTISFAVRLTAFLALPLCALMLFYSEPIVRLLFQRGQFNANSTLITSSALVYYSTGALFFALNYVILRIYYSVQDSKTPMKVYTAALVINIVVGLVLRRSLLIGGVALARSLSDLAAFILLVALLVKKYPEMDFKSIFISTGKMFIISIAGAVVSLFAFNAMPQAASTLAGAVKLFAAFAVFAGIYVGCSFLWEIEEMSSIKNQIIKKFS